MFCVIFSAYFFVFVLISLSFLWQWSPYLEEVNTYILGVFKNITHVSNTVLLTCELRLNVTIKFSLKSTFIFFDDLFWQIWVFQISFLGFKNHKKQTKVLMDVSIYQTNMFSKIHLYYHPCRITKHWPHKALILKINQPLFSSLDPLANHLIVVWNEKLFWANFKFPTNNWRTPVIYFL